MIKNDEEHAVALREIAMLMDSDPALDTPEGARLDDLVNQVVAYEKVRWPSTTRVSPTDRLRIVIEDFGRTKEELAALVGSEDVAQELLAGLLEIDDETAHRLSTAWGLPVDFFVERAD